LYISASAFFSGREDTQSQAKFIDLFSIPKNKEDPTQTMRYPIAGRKGKNALLCPF
jgi:hypothetical protein